MVEITFSVEESKLKTKTLIIENEATTNNIPIAHKKAKLYFLVLLINYLSSFSFLASLCFNTKPKLTKVRIDKE